MTAVFHDLEIEQALLGAILLSNGGVIDIVEPLVSADDFREHLNGRLFELFCSSMQSDGRVSVALVLASMAGRQTEVVAPDGQTVGRYIAHLAAAADAASVRDAPGYAKRIRDFANRRKIIAMSDELKDSLDYNLPTSEIVGAAMELFDEIASSASAGSTPQMSISEASRQSLMRAQHAMQHPGELAGVSFGLADLDQKTSGLKRGELLVIAARPGMGKSALALCIARSTSSANVPTFFCSLEMGGVSLSDRYLADAAFIPGRPIPYFDIAKGKLTDDQFMRLIEARRNFEDAPLLIDQTPGLTVSQIAARARKQQQKLEREGRRLGLVIVDHMHIVRPSSRYSGFRVNEITEISGSLKSLAKELNVPVVALAQLSRSVENRDDKRPTMADLRDSGSIEQDADAIIFLYREAYYLERQTGATAALETARIDRLIDVADQLEAIIAKQRNGPTGIVELFFDVPCNAIRDAGVA